MEDNEIKNEDVELKEVEEKKEEKASQKANAACSSTKMLDFWLFFCFDILLLIFVLGISIFIVQLRENIDELTQKTDQIESMYKANSGEVEDWDEVEEATEEVTEGTTETTEEASETAETTETTEEAVE